MAELQYSWLSGLATGDEPDTADWRNRHPKELCRVLSCMLPG